MTTGTQPSRPLAVPGPPATARRQRLTVLFTDLCGSTEIGRQLEVEQYAELLQRVRAIWHEAARLHQGLVLRTQGDGAMIVFGQSGAGELDGLHAAEAALQIHEQIAALSLDAAPLQAQPQAHSGIHAGVVLVAPGDLESGRFDLVGDVVNTAAKLEQAAQAGQILASAQALGPNAGMLLLEPHALAGVVCIRGHGQARRRFDAIAQRGLTPLVGRDEVMARLQNFLSAAQGPRCALITAPAGLGKTRMLEELALRGWADARHTLRGSCERTLGSEVMQPFAQMLRTLLDQHASGNAALLEAIGHALDSGSVDAYREVFRPLCADASWLLVLDDWQWADDASRRLLLALQGLQRGPRLLLAARPQDDGTPCLADALHAQLRPLVEAETADVVRRWLPDADPFLVQRIHTYSGGVPLFVEELCHSSSAHSLWQLLDGQGAAQQSWIAGLVASRLARLPDEPARLVRAAAVIGEEVPLALLQAAIDGDINPAQLEALAEADFLYRDLRLGLLRFKHGITRNAVYDEIGLYERRGLHQRVLLALESSDEDSASEALAHHSHGAGMWAPAAEHAERAGDKSALAFAMDRARQHYRSALQSLDRIPGRSREQTLQWCRVAAKLGMACIFDPLSLGNDTSTFERAVLLARETGDASAQARAVYWLGYIHYGLGRFHEARDHAREALAMSQRLGDAALTTQIEAALGQMLAATCDYDEALGCMERVVATKRQRARPGSGMAIGSAYTLSCMGSVLADRGDFAAAHRAFDEAIWLLGDSTHPVGNSVRNWCSVAWIWQGRWAEAQRVATESVRIAENTRALLLLAVSRSTLGYARWRESGDADALQMLHDAVGWMAARNGQMFTSLHFGWLAEACVAVGRVAQARQLSAHVMRRARHGERLGEAIACRALAREALGRGQETLAARWLHRAEASAAARGSAREAALNDHLREEFAQPPIKSPNL